MVSSLWKVYLSDLDNLHYHPVGKSGQCHSSCHGLHTGIFPPKAERVKKSKDTQIQRPTEDIVADNPWHMRNESLILMTFLDQWLSYIVV